MEPILFSSIPLSPKIPDVYRALGYSKDKTVVKDEMMLFSRVAIWQIF
ncbi:MAG: hypothetical protein NT079_01855 [Candidatus Omnitrophica bacterium]|nr:hypothetical protein [Candidatus Omnitrophota bacterium]